MRIRIVNRLSTLFGAALVFLLTALPALGQALVDAPWAVANIGKPGIVFVDFQPTADYLRGHIPGAVNSNYAKDGWREDRATDKVPDMFPTKIEPLLQMI